MNSKARIGLVLVGVGDLSGGGGAERYFADLFVAYENSAACRQYELWLIVDESAITRLREINRMPVSERIIDLSKYGRNRFLLAWQLLVLATSGQFDLLHLTLALPRHLPWLWLLCSSQRRACLSLNVNDSEVAARLSGRPLARGLDLAWRTYLAYFGASVLDGVMAWYQNLIEALAKRAKHPRILHAARYCFVDSIRFKPAEIKENLVVYASRLVKVKRPDLFVDALGVAKARAPGLVGQWRFLLLGKGPALATLQARCAELGLQEVLDFDYAPDASRIFTRSRIFVSTQDHENFTSLSMLEAMAAGNAILARDVGQTRAFVRERQNGLLALTDSPEAICEKLLMMLEDEAMTRRWGVESRRIALEEHCAKNVLDEFDAFWQEVVTRRTEVVR